MNIVLTIGYALNIFYVSIGNIARFAVYKSCSDAVRRSGVCILCRNLHKQTVPERAMDIKQREHLYRGISRTFGIIEETYLNGVIGME
jgi:hypothetical protein